MRFQAFAVLPMFIGLLAAAPNPVVRGIFIDGDTVVGRHGNGRTSGG